MTSEGICLGWILGNRTEIGRYGVPVTDGRRADRAAVHRPGLSSMDGFGDPGRVPPAQ